MPKARKPKKTLCYKLTTLCEDWQITFAHFRRALRDIQMKEALGISENLRQVILYEKTELKTEFAKALFGKDFYGPEEVTKAFKLGEVKAPPPDFSIHEMIRAKELGMALVYRTDQIGRIWLARETIAHILQSKGRKTLDNLHFGRDNGAKDNRAAFWASGSPRPGWALVGKEGIEACEDKDYREQTEVLINFLVENFYPVAKGGKLPEIYTHAIHAYEAVRDDLLDSYRPLQDEAAVRIFKMLSINSLWRRTFAEILYDLVLMPEQNTQSLWNHELAADFHGNCCLQVYNSGDLIVFDQRSPIIGGGYTNAVFSIRKQ